MDHTKRYHRARKVILLTGCSNAVLALLKFFFGILGHSTALFADSINSGSDVFVDLMVLFASRSGNQAPDSRHPYGHGRIETVFTVVLSVIVILVSIGLMYEGIRRGFFAGKIIEPNVWTLVVAIFSIILNEVMYHYNLHVSRETHSNLLKANAWHRRSDSFTSLVVLCGIAGTMLGVHYLDGVAAIIVSLIIFKMGFQLGWRSLQELVDSAVDEKSIKAYKRVIKKVNGVQSLHQLRTRLLGGAVFIDVHVQVDPYLSVSEGHYISEQVGRELMQHFQEVADVTAHIDSENDALAMQSILAPSREEFERDFKQCCKKLLGFHQIQKMVLHYLDGKIEAEIYFKCDDKLKTISLEELQQQYQQAVQSIDYIRHVQLICATNNKQ